MFRKAPATPLEPVVEEPAPARRISDASEPEATVVGPGTRIFGELSAEGLLDVGGTIEGPCRVVGLCRLRQGARIVGDLTATSAVIEGELRGRTLEADNVEIGVSGRVKADIRAQRVAIAEGGTLNGHVEMEGPAESPAPVVFKEKRTGRDGGPPASGRS